MSFQSTKDIPAAMLAARRSEIEAAMALYFARSDVGTPSPQDNDAAKRLVDVLLGSLQESDGAVRSLSAAPLTRHYYSLFGDALLPVLKDTMGPIADPTFLARSIDGYWRVVRAAVG